MFGSYNKWWKIITRNESDIKYFKSKIRERHSSINILTENTHIKSIDPKKFTQEAFQYLKEELNNKEESKTEDNYVGFYSENQMLMF